MVNLDESSRQKPLSSAPEKDLKTSTMQFQKAFKDYQTEEADDQKKHALDRMKNQLSLMDLAGKSSNKKEVRVQEQKVAFDFQVFKENPTDQNTEILDHDLNTLRESLEH